MLHTVDDFDAYSNPCKSCESHIIYIYSINRYKSLHGSCILTSCRKSFQKSVPNSPKFFTAAAWDSWQDMFLPSQNSDVRSAEKVLSWWLLLLGNVVVVVLCNIHGVILSSG